MTLGHGQRATSLPPSSVSARAHEQRRDRKTPQKANEERGEPSPGSAGPGDKPFGDSVGRDVPAAAASARRLRPPARCRGGEKLAGPTLCERRGAVSQAGSSVVGAGLRNSRGEVGWRPLSSRTVGARSRGRRGGRRRPGVSVVRALRLRVGASPAQQGCRVQPVAFPNLSLLRASCTNRDLLAAGEGDNPAQHPARSILQPLFGGVVHAGCTWLLISAGAAARPRFSPGSAVP